MTDDSTPIFTRGDRVRDPLTGKLGTMGPTVLVRNRIAHTVLWDGTGNYVPCNFRLEHAPEGV